MNPTWSKTFFGDVDEAVPVEPAGKIYIAAQVLHDVCSKKNVGPMSGTL